MSRVSSAAQTGILLPGPGAIRAHSIQAGLVTLTAEQLELVNKAKRYAMEQSFKSQLAKQAPNNQQQQHKSIQRHQALVLKCRVYVGSISFELKEESVKAAFAPYGTIKSINMSWDSTTQKHKGFAFVEYEIPEAAQLAIEHMNGIQLGGRQIKVGRPSNMPQAAPILQQIQEECKEKNRIYISNVHPELFEPELLELFEPFGRVLSCKLALMPNVDRTQHRGCGFLEFETEAAATEALTMDNFDLGGQVLHVCQATTPAENLTIYGTLETESAQNSANPNVEEDIQLQLERANKEQEKDGHDEDNHVSNSETNHSNSNNNNMTNDDPNSSNILVLRNMVTEEDELDDAFQMEIYEECSKLGSISQVVIYVEKDAKEAFNDRKMDEVRIFIKYQNAEGSKRARQALDGRFFGGRQVSAQYYDRVAFRLRDYAR